MAFLPSWTETAVPAYDSEVTRDGRWWMVHIPELDGLTQARFPGEVELMAREWIAVTTDIPIDQVEVRRVCAHGDVEPRPNLDR